MNFVYCLAWNKTVAIDIILSNEDNLMNYKNDENLWLSCHVRVLVKSIATHCICTCISDENFCCTALSRRNVHFCCLLLARVHTLLQLSTFQTMVSQPKTPLTIFGCKELWDFAKWANSKFKMNINQIKNRQTNLENYLQIKLH